LAGMGLAAVAVKDIPVPSEKMIVRGRRHPSARDIIMTESEEKVLGGLGGVTAPGPGIPSP